MKSGIGDELLVSMPQTHLSQMRVFKTKCKHKMYNIVMFSNMNNMVCCCLHVLAIAFTPLGKKKKFKLYKALKSLKQKSLKQNVNTKCTTLLCLSNMNNMVCCCLHVLAIAFTPLGKKKKFKLIKL